jgi:transposase
MAKTKRSYTREFRADAVRLIFEQGRSVADVARSLDVPVNTLHGWVRDAKEAGLPSGSRRRSPEQEEIARLRRELRNVTEERDILKKAAAYFASSRRGGTRS